MSGFLETARALRHRRVVLGAGAVLLVVIGWLWLSHKPATAALPAGGPGAVAVDTALATRRDVPLYLEGLGNVQAFYTAKITARVDGQLQRVGFVEGQLVKKGDLLAQIDPRPLQAALDQATGMQAKDAAQLDSAKRDLERYTTLAPQNLISQQVLDTQHALVAQLQAQLQVDRASIDNARTQLEYASITAPFSGRTGIRLVDPGNIVHASDTTGIVVVTQMQPISVMFTLPEDVVLQINQALAAGDVGVTALSRDDRTQLDSGTLTLVDNEIDPTTGTVRLKATFANARNALWPGQFVNVRVLMQSRRDVVTLPTAAVEHGPDGLFTYVVRADSSVEARPIKTAEESEGVMVVTDGLQSGERVVTSNQYRLQPGAKVRVVATAAASTVTQSGRSQAGAPAP
ncbi:MAG TPA: efflux RND transporter periplasmic adaptor subunit [Steroidobacteraceae bacterium]|jgi:multidrug efflux system membrane fusion protein|nr:efflux RND transporter periplasmic adaptor subunit [Steroidobacteraceae bacterium]